MRNVLTFTGIVALVVSLIVLCMVGFPRYAVW